ncbi:MAG: YvcK family protein [Clostridiales bacterium]|nr:YvcK family protein [Clostridiales bacterium]
MIKNENIKPKIVVLGGGTGNSVLLKGLKEITDNLVTVVAMGDNGGSTGILREDLGMLPPGDIRACLLALSNTEPAMQKVLNYRFDKGDLKGQSFGNLFLAALDGVYGSFEKAIKESSSILNITGKVYPMTMTNVNLIAKLEDGTTVYGESDIPEVAKEKKVKIEEILLDPKDPKPMEGALEELNDADIIVLGPGSLYTSVIPNLLVDGVVDEINKSNAMKIYICNVMTQDGETTGYGIKEHIEGLLHHAKDLKIDAVLVNNTLIEDKGVLEKYLLKNQEQILTKDEDIKYLEEKGIRLIEGDILDSIQYVKHDAKKVSKILLDEFIYNSKTKEFKI